MSSSRDRNGLIDPAALTADRARALALLPIDPQALARLDAYVALLGRWQAAKNLVGPATLPVVWSRHVVDSLQLLPLAPNARIWVDLGSGAGFPGLVIAIALADTPGARVHLVESNQRKAAFLREAARVTGAPATIHAERLEAVLPGLAGQIDVITARALAPLAALVEVSAELLKTGAIALFLKGQDIAGELTEAAKYWKIQAELLPSVTDPRGRILRVDRAEPIAPRGPSGTLT